MEYFWEFLQAIAIVYVIYKVNSEPSQSTQAKGSLRLRASETLRNVANRIEKPRAEKTAEQEERSSDPGKHE